ncbi:MAG TPA: PhzF family phenazine biosynthesis protein [Vicinamibacterales bacterium]|nr:PhzF family phenazine biosynthesis protein [Vicinamibacterales bacterium]
MRQYRYLHLDVFTDRPFEGNQLAVFPQAQGLEPAVMLQIAREMNFSESTFILPPEHKGDVRMRIFTPGEELPMAGHPTIGSTFALAHEKVIEPGRPLFTFELPVGPTPVELEWDGDQLSFAWMTQQRPKYGAVATDARALAEAVHVDAAEVMDVPLEEVSCGLPFFFLALKSRKAVDQAESDRLGIGRFFEKQKLPLRAVFLFTLAGGADEATAYSRMFAPGLGIAEDPATGAASGPLGCYLVKHGLVDPERAAHFVSLQGMKMQRPSRIHVSIDARGGEITRVRVGGRAVLVGEGTLAIGN